MTTLLNDDAISIAAAHGITERTIATWDPRLARTPRVMVPIEVDALVVRPNQPPTDWADCTYRVPAPNAPISSRRDNQPPPFQNLAAARPPGVYLHWALPSALTRGNDTSPGTGSSANAAASSTSGTNSGSTTNTTPTSNATTAATVFPAIPDRWLVVRVFASPTPGRRAIRGWVLRAWDPPQNQGAANGNQPPAVIDLDSWSETGNDNVGPNPVTAAGPGDVTWSAYYDNVVNRLGFYDGDLAGVTGPLAYMVCGWYSEATSDPLGSAQLASLQDFENKLAGLGWSLKDGEFEIIKRLYLEYSKAATMMGLQTLEAVPSGSYKIPVASTNPPPASAATGATTPIAAIDSRFVIASPAASISVTGALLDQTGAPLATAYTSDGSWWPQNTLLHGYVVALGWPDGGFPGFPNGLLGAQAPGGPPDPTKINVVLANTLIDGLGVLVANDDNSPNDANLFEAFSLGALAEFEQPDGRARLDAVLHATEFSVIDGGFTLETVTAQAMPPTSPPVGTPVTPDPGIFASTAPPATSSSPATPSSPSTGVGTGKFQNVGKFVQAQKFLSPEISAESNIIQGRLGTAINGLGSGATAQATPQTPAHPVQVKRPLPRWVLPVDPVFLLEGAGRSLKYGADGRFTTDGTLACRLSGFCVTELSFAAMDPSGATIPGIRTGVTGDDLLTRNVENGSVPLECEDLLRELVLLDPGSAAPAAQSLAVPGVDPAQVATRLAVEQTAWWAAWDPRFDAGPLLAKSGIAGTLPSPIGISPPDTPWFPVHLDWEVEFLPSAKPLQDWELDEIDYLPQTPPPAMGTSGTPNDANAPAPIPLTGRVHLTGGAAKVAAQTVRKALDQAARSGGSTSLAPANHIQFHSAFSRALISAYSNLTIATAKSQASAATAAGSVDPVDRSTLGDIASTLDSMDVLVGALDSFNNTLRGGWPKAGAQAPPDGSTPNPFFAFRAGYLKVNRLRIVDSFGQFVDLAGSSATTSVDPTKLLLSQTMTTDPATPGLAALPPRFTSQARVRFRYTSADGSDSDAQDQVSPVCGYLMPNHLDGALEFFAADGSNLGFLRPDPNAGVIWENAPGTPSTVGQTPQRAIPQNASLAGIAQGLLDWAGPDASMQDPREAALSALLRTIDSSLWAVDPFGHIGDEHMCLLVGHPVVVLRAELTLEVKEPIAPQNIQSVRIPVRLGSLPHWQDGLLGYFVNGDYQALHCCDAVAAGFAREVGPNRGFLQQINLVPDFYANFASDIASGQDTGLSAVTHPYIDIKDSGTIFIQPGQTLKLTLLVEPLSQVYVTAGLQPRISIAMRRQWVTDALAKLSPTFRFGPVLVQPKQIRMPIAKEMQGTWSWDHRSDVTTWVEDPVANASADALLPHDPASGTEGWLRLTPPDPNAPTNASSSSSGTSGSGGTNTGTSGSSTSGGSG
jgi:hypothetical protein